MLRFLADESCDFAAVRALGAEGLDVLSVAAASAGAEDEQVIAVAIRERRILLTEGKDFGQAVFAAGRKIPGVVLIRSAARARSTLGARTLDLVRKHADRLTGGFVVRQPERIRISVRP